MLRILHMGIIRGSYLCWPLPPATIIRRALSKLGEHIGVGVAKIPTWYLIYGSHIGLDIRPLL